MALSKNEINDKFKNAKIGFDTWRKTTLQHRKSILRKYKKLLEANVDVIAEIISKEHGKPLWDAKSEVGAMVGKIDVTFESYNDRLNAIRSVHADMRLWRSGTRMADVPRLAMCDNCKVLPMYLHWSCCSPSENDILVMHVV